MQKYEKVKELLVLTPCPDCQLWSRGARAHVFDRDAQVWTVRGTWNGTSGATTQCMPREVLLGIRSIVAILLAVAHMSIGWLGQLSILCLLQFTLLPPHSHECFIPNMTFWHTSPKTGHGSSYITVTALSTMPTYTRYINLHYASSLASVAPRQPY